DLRDERQRLLLDGRRGLEDRDQQSDGEPGQQEGRRDLERDLHCLHGEMGDRVLVHRSPRQWKDVTSDWMTRCQPATSTNNRILNGSEMRTGGSIIIPIDISVAEMIMSMIRNGR